MRFSPTTITDRLRAIRGLLGDAVAAAAATPATPPLQGYPFTPCPVGANAPRRR